MKAQINITKPGRILKQFEIDELVSAINTGTLNDWKERTNFTADGSDDDSHIIEALNDVVEQFAKLGCLVNISIEK